VLPRQHRLGHHDRRDPRSVRASVGSIYHFFGSKDGLATQLYVEVLADHHANYLDALRTSRSAKAGVTGAVHAHLRWVAANRDRARYVFNWRELEVIDRGEPAVAALNEELYCVASEWLAGHVRAGRIKLLSPRMFQALWMGRDARVRPVWDGAPDEPRRSRRRRRCSRRCRLESGARSTDLSATKLAGKLTGGADGTTRRRVRDPLTWL